MELNAESRVTKVSRRTVSEPGSRAVLESDPWLDCTRDSQRKDRERRKLDRCGNGCGGDGWIAARHHRAAVRPGGSRAIAGMMSWSRSCMVDSGRVMVSNRYEPQRLTVAMGCRRSHAVENTTRDPREGQKRQSRPQAPYSASPIHRLTAANVAFGFRRVNSYRPFLSPLHQVREGEELLGRPRLFSEIEVPAFLSRKERGENSALRKTWRSLLANPKCLGLV